MTGAEAVKTVANNLRDHPVAFAFIVLVVIFQAAQVWILRDVAANNLARFNAQDKLLETISKSCFNERR